MNRRGQALMETIGFIGLLAILLSSLACFTRWLLVREKLLAGLRQAALLYSSGQYERTDVEAHVRLAMTRGWPHLDAGRIQVIVERQPGQAGRFYRLDQIRVVYWPDRVLGRYFTEPMEEKCVIKHAPVYEPSLMGLGPGPAVPW